MPYLYETHCHCAQCSRCAHSDSREMVRAYRKAGYAGLVLTDHFIFGNTAVSRSLPWADRMHRYYDAYLEAREEGEKLDFDVIFGFEHYYGSGKEMLVYGVGLDFLLAHPEIQRIPLEEFAALVRSAGGLLIHAHPYRDRYYIDLSVQPRIDLVDGIEVYNACSAPGEDVQALRLSREHPAFILSSGGDIHDASDPRIGSGGILLPHRVRNEREFVQALRQKRYPWMVHGRLLTQIREADLP